MSNHGKGIKEEEMWEKKLAGLRESQEQLKLVLEGTDEGIWDWDMITGEVRFDDNWTRIMGYTPGKMKFSYTWWKDSVAPESFEVFKQALNDYFEGRTKYYELEYRIITNTGEWKWIWARGKCVAYDKQQNPIRMIGTHRDITDRKEAEEQLRQRNRELTALNHLAQRVSSSLSVDQVTREALRAVSEALSVDLAMLYLHQDDCLNLQNIEPEAAASLHKRRPPHRVGQCLCGLAVSEKKPVFSTDIHNDPQCTLQECKKAGMLSFAALPLISGNTLIGVLGLASAKTRDFKQQVTFLETLSNEIAIGLQNALLYQQIQQHAERLEQRVSERTAQLQEKTAELEQANKKLIEAGRMKSLFFASMAHELINPLNSILGFTGIMLMGMTGQLNPEQEKQLQIVKRSASYILTLINDMLDISRIEARNVKLSCETFTLDDVINEVLETFSKQAADRGLEIITAVPPGITLHSDMKRVRQILTNLVGNAVKFTRKGNIKITARTVENKNLEISVADTGIGIKKEIMSKLFLPFQKLALSQGKKSEGTGVGLYLCKNLLHLLGGDIRVYSEYGKGSEFSVTLPLKYREPKES